MVAQLDLPRSAWADHPHYPDQVLLLQSHQSFRRMSRWLIERADQGDSRTNILASFGWWKAGMANHEAYEEGKLYPYLAHRFGLDVKPMEAGHQLLHDHDQRVRQAAPDTLLDALEAHHDVLMEHLDLEERTVIPALLALTPDEFADYSHHSIGWLLNP